MLKLFKIAVTGPFGSGKSTVGLVLKGLGAFVIDADNLVRDLLVASQPVGKELIQCFGQDILENHEISKIKLADIVFNDVSKLRELEKIIHPLVLKEIDEFFESVKQQNHYHLFVVEFPLLFELNKEKEFDYIILVNSDPEICQERIKKRGYLQSEYEKRMHVMLPISTKIENSDFVITNNGTYEELRKNVEQVVEKLSHYPK